MPKRTLEEILALQEKYRKEGEAKNAVTQALEREAQFRKANPEAKGPWLQDYVDEMAQSVKDSEERRKKMTHAELVAQIHKNRFGTPD